MDMNAIDAKMASLMNLRQEWIDKGFPADSRNELKSELKSSPAELEIHKKLVESLEYEVDQGDVPLVAERGPQMLPIRNRCTDIPGHVTCFKELNGLVHGGIIKAPTYTLTCRAFRLVWMKRRKKKIGGNYYEKREVVVAGVCEQKDSSGGIINTWSTATGLPLKDWYIGKQYYYYSTSISLPPSAIRKLEEKKKGGIWFGYYIPDGWGWQDASDTGQPTYDHWGKLKGEYIWNRYPSGAASVESPFFNQQFSCSEGYVICTPYIKVYHPDPNMKETSVWMIGAFRHQDQRKKGGVKFYGRSARWYCRTFS